MSIETNSYDLLVKSDTNASLVKYEGVIHKYSFINDECYSLEVQERVEVFNRFAQRLLKELNLYLTINCCV